MGISRTNRVIIIQGSSISPCASGHTKCDHDILSGYLIHAIREREKSQSITKRMAGTSKEATHWVT